ncbi:MAG: inosine-5'-monophosphate dehydrogenase [Chloroflexota bacterium]|nr:MAG: inosine-5'-monophosphate dehydrogenase [Chloroflexota bacterium]
MNRQHKILGEGLGFDDVMLVPRRSTIRSRYSGEIETTAPIAKGAPPIAVPIISANMDTVTGWRMATLMANLGGFGVIHRFMSIEEQVNEVRKVKERMRVLEDRPPVIRGDATIQDARRLLTVRERGYVILYEGETFNGEFVGIATPRDFDAGKPDMPLSQVMTPRNRIHTVPQGTSLEDAVKVMRQYRVEKVPMVAADGKLIGVYTTKDYKLYNQYPLASLDSRGRLLVGAAIGVQRGEIERALALAEAEVDVLVLDIAHGGLDYTQEILRRLKIQEGVKTPIVAGNVASTDGAKYVRDSGADGVKVGVGPGYVCETRDVAGVGIPQITAIMNAAEAFAHDSEPLPIIGDGGIRKPGDVAKAIAAGAHTVMVGSLFAGTEESPGEPVDQDGMLKKMVRGMASSTAFEKRLALGSTTTSADDYVPEGRTTFTPYKGSASKVLKKLRGGLLSGMSYSDAHNIAEMHEKAQFIIVRTPAMPEQRRPLQS